MDQTPNKQDILDSSEVVLKLLDESTSLLGTKMIAILQAAKSGQKAVNYVVDQLEKQTKDKLTSIGNKANRLPKYKYHVVHSQYGTKLQITIPVEDTLEAITVAADRLKELFNEKMETATQPSSTEEKITEELEKEVLNDDSANSTEQ